MKTTQLLDILNELNNMIANPHIIQSEKRQKLQKELSLLIHSFQEIDVPKHHQPIYDALCKKGKDTIKALKQSKDIKSNLDKMKAYLRYLHAAKGDFEGRTNEINKYLRVNVFTSILFLALSPQFFGFILPAIFFVPIFLGIRGVKNRSINGLYMSLSVVPVALMTSFIWIRYGLYALSHYQASVEQVMADTGRSLGFSKALVTVPPILGVILLFLAILQVYRGLKSKDLFV